MSYNSFYDKESANLSSLEKERLMKWALEVAKDETKSAQSKDKKWLKKASNMSKSWRAEAISTPAEERAIKSAGYLLLRGLSDIDSIATAMLYQILNGKRQWNSDYMTPKWREENAKAEAWRRKVVERKEKKRVRA